MFKLFYISKYMMDQEGGDQMGGKTRKMVFKEGHCAPGNKGVMGSCLDEKLIKKVGKIVNKMRKKDKSLPEVNCSDHPEKYMVVFVKF